MKGLTNMFKSYLRRCTESAFTNLETPSSVYSMALQNAGQPTQLMVGKLKFNKNGSAERFILVVEWCRAKRNVTTRFLSMKSDECIN